MLKVYFDGSGKEHDPQCRFVTLAGFATTEEAWSKFDLEWRRLLERLGPVSYMHMNDAIRHEGEFRGWGPVKTKHLINGLLELIVNSSFGNQRFCGFRCTVDLMGYARWKDQNNIPAVAQLCANIVFGKMFVWYSQFPDSIISSLQIYFDRGDPFLNVLMQQWNNKEITGEHVWWRLVRTIAPKAMQDSPALQAADMLAWANNRLKTFGSTGWAGGIAQNICTQVQCWNYDLTEDVLASKKHKNK